MIESVFSAGRCPSRRASSTTKQTRFRTGDPIEGGGSHHESVESEWVDRQISSVDPIIYLQNSTQRDGLFLFFWLYYPLQTVRKNSSSWGYVKTNQYSGMGECVDGAIKKLKNAYFRNNRML